MTKVQQQLHPIKFQKTFFLIKPDAVMRGLVGKIIGRIERTGLKITAIKMLQPDERTIRDHYPMSDEAWIARLGEKSLSGFSNLDVSAKEILGTEDKTVLGKAVSENLVDYLRSGPIVCMIIEGMQAIDMVRKLCGHTLPFLAGVGTIRGDFSVDSPAVANAENRSIHNLVHASETPEEAENEIKLWFDSNEIHDYQLSNESVTYTKYY